MLKITCKNKSIELSYGETSFPPMELNPSNIYALDQLLTRRETRMLLAEGIDLDIADSITDETYSLYRELLFQVIYLHTTHYLYPKLSTKAPAQNIHALEDYEHYLSSLKNMPLFKDMCHCAILQDYMAGAPAVIVSPGPSVDIEHLRRLKGRAYIIAAGRVLPRLIAGGVVPDFLYVQDTADHAWNDIFNIQDGPAVIDTALIANPVGHIHGYAHRVSHVYKAWNYYSCERDIMPKIDEIPPSSTSGAFSLARMMGAGEIVFMGNDLGGLGELPPLKPVDVFFGIDDVLRQGKLPEQFYHQVAYFTMTLGGKDAWTSCDYIAGLQWLKTRIYHETLQNGITFHDNSKSGFLRDTGMVKELSPDYSCPEYETKPLPKYTPQFHPEKNVKMQLGRLAMVRRSILKDKPIPPSGLVRPYNSVFKGVKQYDGNTMTLEAKYKNMVLERLDALIKQLETLLAIDW